MEVEKRRSRGSFLNFFDWNGKSRKKLFKNDSELSGELKKGAQNAENILKSQLSGLPIVLDEHVTGSSNMRFGDYNCASSVNSDGGRETRAPGVVARLMGLDSLPSTSTSELSSSASFDSPPFRSDHHYDRNAYDLLTDYGSMDHINIRSILQKSSWNTLESRRQKVQKRPIERFQTEILPPRSAKSIPLAHHKLLSPIKTPAFICKNNAANVIEASANIMEASPRAYNVNKMPSIGASTVPLRIRDLKEKVEAAHHASVVKRQSKPNTPSDIKGKATDKSYSKSKLVPASRGMRESESSNHSRTRGKVSSLATQAKKDVQSREMLISCNRTIVKNKEQNVKLNQFSRSQQVMQHALQQRISACKTNNVLRHNSQKQNVGTVKGKTTPKLPASSQQTRRTRSLDGSTGANESSYKAVSKSKSGPKRFNSLVTDDQKPLLLSKTTNTFQRKRSAGRDVLIKETSVDTMQKHFDERSINCNNTTDGSTNHRSDDMKQSMDVVSFTFTSPLKSHSTAQVMEMKNNFDLNSFQDNEGPNPQALSFSSSELHMLDGCALSALLDKKLQELTFMIQSSQCNLIQEGPSAIYKSAMSDSLAILPSTTSIEDGKSQFDLDGDMDGLCEVSCSASDNSVLNLNQNCQGTESTEASYSSYKIMEIGNKVDPMYSREGSKMVSNFQQTNDIIALKVELELSESSLPALSGSVSIGCPSRKCSLKDFSRSNNWQFKYIKDMLDKLELMGEEFMLGLANKVIMPSLFDVLENYGYHTESNGEEHSELRRKVLFDVVDECLNLRCRQALLGSCNGWIRWVTLVQRKDILAEDLYGEMVGWTSMGELMVDELVEKDMSTRYGRWLDFSVEESEEGVEIEWTLWNSLVDELVSDLLQFS